MLLVDVLGLIIFSELDDQSIIWYFSFMMVNILYVK